MKRPHLETIAACFVFFFYVIQTCDSPAVFLIWVSGLFHPGENLFTHWRLLVWPPGERALKRLHLRQFLALVRSRLLLLLLAAPKPADIMAEVIVLLDADVCSVAFLHFHEMCTGAPFDLLTERWQPNVTWQVSREPWASGLRGSRERGGERDGIREETTWSILSTQ